MNPKFLLIAIALFANLTPALATTCTAKIKSGKTPYPHVKANIDIPFWSHSIEGYEKVKVFVGERLLMVPIKNLYDISPGCSELKKYIENY